MKTRTKKLCSLLLTLVMLLGLLPAGAIAAPAAGDVYKEVTEPVEIETAGEFLLVSESLNGKYYAMGEPTPEGDFCLTAHEVNVQNGAIAAADVPAGAIELQVRNSFDASAGGLPVYTLSGISGGCLSNLFTVDIAAQGQDGALGAAIYMRTLEAEQSTEGEGFHVIHTGNEGDLLFPVYQYGDLPQEKWPRMRLASLGQPARPVFSMHVLEPGTPAVPVHFYRLWPASVEPEPAPEERFSSAVEGLTLEVEPRDMTNAFRLKFSGQLSPNQNGDYTAAWNWRIPAGTQMVGVNRSTSLEELQTVVNPDLEITDLTNGLALCTEFVAPDPLPQWWRYTALDANSRQTAEPVYFQLDFSQVQLLDDQGQDNNPVEVNGVTYPAFEQAVAAIGTEGVITLRRDLKLQGSGLAIPAGKTVTLDLNGFSIRSIPPIANEGMLRIVNWNPARVVACVSNGTYDYRNRVFTHIDPAHLLLCAGIYEAQFPPEVIGKYPKPGEPVTPGGQEAWPVYLPNAGERWMVGEPMHMVDQRLEGVVPTQNAQVNVSGSVLKVLQQPEGLKRIDCMINEYTLAAMQAFGLGFSVTSDLYAIRLKAADVAKLSGGANFQLHSFGDGEDAYNVSIPQGDGPLNDLTLIVPAAADEPIQNHYVFALDRSGNPTTALGQIWVWTDEADGSRYYELKERMLQDGTFGIYASCPHPGMEHYPGETTTCTREGRQEAWHCGSCGKWYGDVQGSQILYGIRNAKNLVTRRDLHWDQNEDGLCDSCGSAMPYFKKVTAQEQITEGGVYLAVAEQNGSHVVMASPRLTEDPYMYQLPSYPITVTRRETGEEIITYENYVLARRGEAMDLRLDRPYQNYDPTRMEYGLRGVINEHWYEFNAGNGDTSMWFGGEKYDVVAVEALPDQTRVEFVVGQMGLQLTAMTGLVDFPGQILFGADFSTGEKPNADTGVTRLPIQLYQLVETLAPQPQEFTLTVEGASAVGLEPIPGEKQNKYRVTAGETVSLTAAMQTAEPVWTSEPAGLEFTPTPTGCTFVMPEHDVTVRAEQKQPPAGQKYTLNVVDGTVVSQLLSAPTVEQYEVTEGTAVHVAPRTAQNFRGWISDPVGLEFTEENGAWRFTMPGHDLQVRAINGDPVLTVLRGQLPGWTPLEGTTDRFQVPVGTQLTVIPDATEGWTGWVSDPAGLEFTRTAAGWSFTMPEHHVVIQPTLEPPVETYRIYDAVHCTVQPRENIPAGTKVTVTAEEIKDQVFDHWTARLITGAEVTIPATNPAEFTMPAANIQSITAVYRKPQVLNRVHLTLAVPALGEIPGEAATEDTTYRVLKTEWSPAHEAFTHGVEYTVTIQVEASPGYQFFDPGANLNGKLLSPAHVSTPDATTVTVTETFPALEPAPVPHSITVTGGKVYQQKSDAAPREEVTESLAGWLVELEADQPKPGWRFDHWESSIQLRDNTAAETVFPMPEQDVTIKAVFVRDAKLLSAVNMWVEAPVAGLVPAADGSADFTYDLERPIQVPSNLAPAQWTPAVSECFAENESYTVTLTVTAPGGYCFGANTRFQVNNDPDYPVTVISSVLDGKTVQGEQITDGAEAVTISYTFPEPTGAREYPITTESCSASVQTPEASRTAQSAIPGTVISMMPYNPPRGCEFDHYETTGVTLADPKVQDSSFEMPACAVTVTAVFREVEHTHALSQNWIGDATGHWHECSICGRQMDETAPHDFGNGWHFTEDGQSEIRSCQKCGYREIRPRTWEVTVQESVCNMIVVPPTAGANTTIPGAGEAGSSVTYDTAAMSTIIQEAASAGTDQVALELENVTETVGKDPEINEDQKAAIEGAGERKTVYELNLYLLDDEGKVLTERVSDFGSGTAVVKVPAPRWLRTGDDAEFEVVRVEENGATTPMDDYWFETVDGVQYVCWRTDGHSVYMLSSTLFAEVGAAETDGLNVILKRTCQAGRQLIAAGYQGGQMTALGTHTCDASDKAGAQVKLSGGDFRGADSVKVFLLGSDFAPTAPAAIPTHK